MSAGLPQPYEGVTTTDREGDDLLSLDPKALPRRAAMAALAMCLWNAVVVGEPAPLVARMWERMRDPRPGDLVLETSRYYLDYANAEAFGVLVAHRMEWWDTDEEWARLRRYRERDKNDKRPTDTAWYVQYGPSRHHIYRWVNATFITVPTDAKFCQVQHGTPTPGGGVSLTRADLLAALADTGIQLR
jgi:hypothetical protein